MTIGRSLPLVLGGLMLVGCSSSPADPEALPDASTGTPPDARALVAPDEPGAFATGSLTTRVTLPVSERTLEITVYFPALADATPAYGLGPFAVLVFSHGNRTTPQLYESLLRHVASHGFVIGAAAHPGSTTLDTRSAADTMASVVERPVEVAAVLDELVRLGDEAGALDGLVDIGRAGIFGQSFGGYTTLMAAGASIDPLAELTVPTTMELLTPESYCERVGWAAGSATCAVMSAAIASDSVLVLLEPRFRAAVALTPPSEPFAARGGVSDVERPVLVIAGQQDQAVPYEAALLPLYEALPAPKWLVTQEPAGHNASNQLCGLPGPADGTPREYCPTALRDIGGYIVAFFGWQLRGEVEFASWFTAEHAASLDRVQVRSSP